MWNDTNFEEIEGTVENIIYCNAANGYTVCNVLLKDGTEMAVVGCLPALAEGELVRLTGKFVIHPDYGEQFKAETYERIMPREISDILRYLSSGIIKGVGPATAKKIINRFGCETLEIIADYPARLSEISGISEKKALEIGESYAQQLGVRDVVMFLQKYGISSKFALKIYQKLGANTVELIKLNPYIIADQINGIGFKKVDSIAISMGVENNDKRRVESGVIYCLSLSVMNGHTCLPKAMLIEDAKKLMEVDEGEVENAINTLVFNEKLYIDSASGLEHVYLPAFKNAENYTARSLVEHTKNKYAVENKKVQKIIDGIQKKDCIVLAERQCDAVRMAVNNGVTVITGGPGTGKTTIINAIIKTMSEMGCTVCLAAPTGRAAKRMTDMCGVEAKTLHRLLEVEYRDDDEAMHFAKNENNKIDCDVLIIDEMSMVDIILMAAVFKALKPQTRLVLVGDADQLPSVSAGYVLRDIISSGAVKTVALTEIFRQAKESAIVVNAHLINHGEYPVLNGEKSDFFLVRRDSGHDIVNTIVELCVSRLPKAYGYDSVNNIQVISPTRKGSAGIVSLNEQLQKAINPPSADKAERSYGSFVFREGDKVMQNKNNYDIPWTRGNDVIGGVGVFNGDVGFIKEIDNENEFMIVVFDEKEYMYSFSQLDELELAYAITVHKSQGSEFDAVVMPMYPCAPMLQNRNLLYTAVTRAKKLVVLVGRENCVNIMVDNANQQRRFSGLCRKLEELSNEVL